MSDFIKSPLNYTGGKYKLLPQIAPLFPKNINTFIDLFAGGGNVGVNVNAKKIVLNDMQTQVIELLEYIYQNGTTVMLQEIKNIISEYNLDRENKEGYLGLREAYNSSDKSPMVFYSLICHAFSNQIRFNRHGEYNMPFGKRTFNPKLQKRFVSFSNHIKTKNISFTNNDFRKLNPKQLKSEDFVYCDPPYLITMASYNEQDGWNENDESDLLLLLDNLNEDNIKFALSNVFKNKGKTNHMLIDWSKKYNVHYLNHTYANSNYHAKDKSRDSTVEVLITNY